MTKYLDIAQIIVTALLVISVLLQSRGSGLSSLLGGGGEFYSTRRGLEKKIFIATVVLAVIFLGLGVARLLIR
ncbi:MAG: preprotein translocase subunit SecG [Patescibacteria group bacterium]|nr:preprotein translocase subunit SecG [Patescibacteria group bacterium]MDD5121365.1 preprotein translocase subunit SecG [Patescibacteria group bacterium]MDD5395716.1 preprotein translocase subunit SecG [Patescibacteria group bacterium]